jgi:hypothetical protein
MEALRAMEIEDQAEIGKLYCHAEQGQQAKPREVTKGDRATTMISY